MENRWDDQVAVAYSGPLGECVYGSRLLGGDPNLVLHGGGNTSVKAPFSDITGVAVDALYVKGSGWDLASIEREGFSPLPLARLHSLLGLDSLSDLEMMRELSAARLDPSAPMPSVETLLHALLPYSAVQHSHADVIVALTNTPDGWNLVEEVMGDSVLIIPYVMPGFELAKEVAKRWPNADGKVIGMVLMNHGLFTFGPDTRTAYQYHAELITKVEDWLQKAAPLSQKSVPTLPKVDCLMLAELRRDISRAAGRPMIMGRHTGKAVSRFVSRPDLSDLARRGPLTPDHVIRTKPHPMMGREVENYAARYREYFAAQRHRARTDVTMLDPAPRVVLDPELGMLTAGETPKAADIAADIYLHTIPVLEVAEDHLGGYAPLPLGDLFEVEYWDLEQAKLRRAGELPSLAGRTAVVTGAASGIGRACAAELLARGCAVAGFDIDKNVGEAFDGPAWLGATLDVTERSSQETALDQVVERFGGVDILVPAAGVFGKSTRIGDLDSDRWREIMAVNTDAVADLFALAHPLLARSPVTASVVVIASRNVSAPGRGAAAYSSSKAALTQLARVAAMEWAQDGIRVNMVHPDAVFDTGLWSQDLLESRAADYGLSVEEYKTRNLLGVEITSQAVGRVVADLCDGSFYATTGAQIPIDGGHDRSI